MWVLFWCYFSEEVKYFHEEREVLWLRYGVNITVIHLTSVIHSSIIVSQTCFFGRSRRSFFCFEKENVRALHSFLPVFCDTSVGICVSWILIPQKRGKQSSEVVVVTSKIKSLAHFNWENNTFFIPAWKTSITTWLLVAAFTVLSVPVSIFSV